MTMFFVLSYPVFDAYKRLGRIVDKYTNDRTKMVARGSFRLFYQVFGLPLLCLPPAIGALTGFARGCVATVSWAV